MPPAPELDAELARMRRTMRRLIAVMTLGLVVGVGAIAAVVGVTLSSVDKEAARSFDDGWRKSENKDMRAISQARPATTAKAPGVRPPATAGAAPPSAASSNPPPASKTATAPQTTGAGQTDAQPAPAATAATDDPLNMAAQQATKTKRHGRGHFARARARPFDQDRARSADDVVPGAGRSERVIVLRRPGVEPRPQGESPPDDGGGRESPRGGPFGIFGELFGQHPD